MKIATYNVNSVRARLPNVLEWLQESKPDVVCLQEIKCVDEQFPYMEIEDAGYNVAVYGQKTYNGVAILSRYPIDETIKDLPGDDSDEQARYIECVISADGEVYRVISVYVPNGGEPNGERWGYKMKFFDRLKTHAEELLSYDEKLIIAGDYNVAPEDIDVFSPETLRGTTCFHPDEQEKYRAIENLGLTDVWRAKNPDVQAFSWWDYRAGGWQNNKGMRIDHLMLSPQAADVVSEVGIDDETRGKTKASDHAPVWCKLVVC
jgi:exodeoxyribonuclease-3